MQLRIITDQPWQVSADVLAVPIIGEPAFDGELGELNRRSGGELAALATFGELKAKRYHAVLAASGELPAGRLLAVGAGEADTLDRETIQRLGATIERRLGGRDVHSLAIWLGDLGSARRRRRTRPWPSCSCAAWSKAAMSPRRSTWPSVESAPPALDELILVAPGAAMSPP
jgi:hypothetical protein